MNRMSLRCRAPAASAAAVLLLAGCVASSGDRQSAAAPHRITPRQLEIGQIGFAAEAQFAVCPGGGCPKPTPKTLAGLPGHTAALPAALSAPPIALASPRTVVLDAAAPADAPAAAESRTIDALSVTFAPGASVLSPEMAERLREALPAAREAARIVIRGRTDSTGAQALNQRLALLRAAAVREFFLRNGVGAAHLIKLDARGACCYLASNAEEQGRAQNRRVEVEFEPRPPERAA